MRKESINHFKLITFIHSFILSDVSTIMSEPSTISFCIIKMLNHLKPPRYSTQHMICTLGKGKFFDFDISIFQSIFLVKYLLNNWGHVVDYHTANFQLFKNALFLFYLHFSQLIIVL